MIYNYTEEKIKFLNTVPWQYTLNRIQFSLTGKKNAKDFYRDLKEIEKKGQAAAKKVVTQKKFQGKWTAPVPKFTAVQPQITD